MVEEEDEMDAESMGVWLVLVGWLVLVAIGLQEREQSEEVWQRNSVGIPT